MLRELRELQALPAGIESDQFPLVVSLHNLMKRTRGTQAKTGYDGLTGGNLGGRLAFIFDKHYYHRYKAERTKADF